MAETTTVRAQVAVWVVECRSTSDVVVEAFRRVFGPAPRPAEGAIPDLVIDAEIASAPAPTSTDAWTIIDEDASHTLWSTPFGGVANIEGSVAVFDRSSARLDFVDEASVNRTFHTLVTHVLNHCAHLADLVPTHSALVGVDHTWFLAIGPSGVGKSTTCLAASSAGYSVAADDTCLLKLDQGELWAQGVPRAPSLPRAEHGQDDGRSVDHRRRSNDPGFVLTPGWKRLDAIVVLEHGAAGLSVLEPVTRMRVIERLAASAASALAAPNVVDAVPGVLRAASNLPATTLALGSDPSRRLESTAAALSAAALTIRNEP